jgi:D-serine deaminase-like pyridoxal phosphate-dependent protein
VRSTPDPAQHACLERATAGLEAPFVAVDLEAFDANADDLARRAGGTPIRVASKSVRVRSLLERVLLREDRAYRGVLALTLPEALHLVREGTADDVLVAYPTVDRDALRALAAGADREQDARIAVMVDDVAHLDLIAAAGARPDAPVRVALELDASLRLAGGRIHLGVRRSPVHAPDQLATLAAEAERRPGVELIGVMAYEAQVAGVGDAPPGRRAMGRAIGAMQRRSANELAERRAEAVAAVQRVLGRPLELVNAGGTGSLETSTAEAAVTEVAAGSGLYGSALFDGYSAFTPRPALFLAVPVVRRPAAGIVTVQGGGWVASGPAGADRLPLPWFPAGLALDSREGAGEAQTPLRGAPADRLTLGDRVWLRPAKAGEPLERIDRVHLVSGDEVVATAPTYRGDGQAFG